jgi:hypothetical protein
MNFSQKLEKYKDKYLNLSQTGGIDYVINYLMTDDIVPLFNILDKNFDPPSAGGLRVLKLKIKNLDSVKKNMYKINGIIKEKNLQLLRVTESNIEIPDSPSLDLSNPVTENIYYRIDKNTNVANVATEIDSDKEELEKIKKRLADLAIEKTAEQKMKQVAEAEAREKKLAKTAKDKAAYEATKLTPAEQIAEAERLKEQSRQSYLARKSNATGKEVLSEKVRVEGIKSVSKQN